MHIGLRLVFAMVAGVMSTHHAAAAEIRVLAAGGVGPVLNRIVAPFEQASGHTLVITIVSGSKTKDAFGTGAGFDAIVSLPSDVDALTAEGALDPASRDRIARTGLGVAVLRGAPKPDVGSVEAFRATLLKARAVSHSAGASGAHFLQLLDRLGIANEMKPKLKLNPAGARVVDQVVSGEAELSVNVTATILDPRVELAGLLPDELQNWIDFAAAVSRQARAPDAAADFLRFLHSQDAIAAFRAVGMEPIVKADRLPR